MHLSKTFEQNDRTGILESSLTIEVDFNPQEDTVDAILHVTVFNHKHRVTTNITYIMWEMFEAAVDSMIESVNWKEVYANQVNDILIPCEQ